MAALPSPTPVCQGAEPCYAGVMHIHPLIEDSATLAALCTRLATSDFVAVDTEFMRENSYWPELCLIQIANTEEAAAIDPMAPGIDLTPLLNLLTDNEDVLKVFHAGGQDIEIVYNLTGKTPFPLFDTQVAAMALGQGSRSAIRTSSMPIWESRSTRARGLPTGRGGRSTTGRSTMRSPTSPICR